jgi:hypothetical protein
MGAMMDSLDVHAMKRIAVRSHELAVERAHGRSGMDAMRELIEFLILLFAHQDPDAFSGTLYVLHRIGGANPTAIDTCVKGSAPAVERRIDRLPAIGESITVVDVHEGVYRVWESATLAEADASEIAIVYRYEARVETFVIAGHRYQLDKPASSYASNFSRPRFSSLREALIDYGNRFIRKSTCFIFRDAWEHETRLFLKPKPEQVIRRSLQQYLRATLADAITRPEQVVDESRPVDLRVEWDLTAQEAIIEIKWLGASRENGRITVKYSESRARDGARQLAGYLAKSRQSGPTRQLRGYLVVIDARRRHLKKDTTTLTRAEAMHYERAEITYKPEYHKQCNGFEVPIRMFAEPV